MLARGILPVSNDFEAAQRDRAHPYPYVNPNTSEKVWCASVALWGSRQMCIHSPLTVSGILQKRLWPCRFLETNRITDFLANIHIHLFCDPASDRHSRNATRLCAHTFSRTGNPTRQQIAGFVSSSLNQFRQRGQEFDAY